MASTGEAILGRIQRRLKALGMSENLASRQAGLSRDTIRSIRRGLEDGKQRGVSTETLDKLAPVLRTTSRWLLEEAGDEAIEDLRSEDVAATLDDVRSEDIASEQGDLRSEDIAESLENDQPQARKVKIRGYVSAGLDGGYYRFADDAFETVEAPEGATDQTAAVEIKGVSFGPLMLNWLVFYDDVRSPVTADLIGKTCVVGLSDDRVVLKKIERNGKGGYRLISNSNEPPLEDAKIEWAAKVIGMKQR